MIYISKINYYLLFVLAMVGFIDMLVFIRFLKGYLRMLKQMKQLAEAEQQLHCDPDTGEIYNDK